MGSDQADIGKNIEGLSAKVIQGDPFSEDCTVTSQVASVRKLLGPLTPSDVPTTRCIGLNYAKHSNFLVGYEH